MGEIDAEEYRHRLEALGGRDRMVGWRHASGTGAASTARVPMAAR